MRESHQNRAGPRTCMRIQFFSRRLTTIRPHGDSPQDSNQFLRRLRLLRRLDPRAQGPRARQAAPGHVHPHGQPAAHHPGSDRQRGRRSARGPRQEDQGHAACRRLGRHRGRRPRHSLRPASRGKSPGDRTRLHPSARRRQVRQGQGGPTAFPAACTGSA